MVLVIIGVGGSHFIPWHGSLRQVPIRIIRVCHHRAALPVGNRSQSGLPVIVILQGKFCIIPHPYGKGRFISGAVIIVVFDHILMFRQFCGFLCNLSRCIVIGKGGAVLCRHIPIGIVGIGMFRFFPCLFFFCHHLRQAVLVIVGILLCVAVLIYCYR